MLGKNHGKGYRETRIREPASYQIPESFLYNSYLGKKAVPQKPSVSSLGDVGGRSTVIPGLCGRQRPGSEGFGLLGTLSCTLSGPHVVFCALRHQEDLQHCDLYSPGMLLVAESGKPCMLDFLGEMDLLKKARLSLSSGWHLTK